MLFTIVNYPLDVFVILARFQSVLCGGLSFFMFATPILIHRLTMKYVLNMTLDRETKTFEVTTYSIILRRKKMQFA